MLEITKEEEDALLSIIPDNYPLLDIYHLSESCQYLSEALENLTQKLGYNYDFFMPEPFYQESEEKCSSFTIQKFDFKKHRYNLHAKVYDFVFIMIDIQAVENQALFLKKLHAIVKNGGKILFILSQEDDLRILEEKLIEHNYVAVNPIEDTFQNYQILSAQKMHGWGN